MKRVTLSGNMIFFFYKFPLFCDNMDNFVHNAVNKTSEFLQYVVVNIKNSNWFGNYIQRDEAELQVLGCTLSNFDGIETPQM